jgi:peptidyl-prolyl cis-trans isomerase B (cyclophilin B)
VAKGGYQKRRIQEKREAERRARKRARRNKVFLQWGIGVAVLALLGTVLGLTLTGGGKKSLAKSSSSPTPSPSISPYLIPGCSQPNAKKPSGKQYSKAPPMTIDTSKTYTVKLVTTCGPITWKLDPKLSPKTVNAIVFLVKNHFYDNQIFHRVQNETSFAIVQGGDPTGTGSGGPGFQYDGGKPPATTKYLRGILAIANSGTTATDGSQFFMVVHDWPDLPPDYTVFGKVVGTDSFATLDRMIQAKGSDLGNGLGIRPIPDIEIISATVTES